MRKGQPKIGAPSGEADSGAVTSLVPLIPPHTRDTLHSRTRPSRTRPRGHGPDTQRTPPTHRPTPTQTLKEPKSHRPDTQPQPLNRNHTDQTLAPTRAPEHRPEEHRPDTQQTPPRRSDQIRPDTQRSDQTLNTQRSPTKPTRPSPPQRRLQRLQPGHSTFQRWARRRRRALNLQVTTSRHAELECLGFPMLGRWTNSGDS